MADNEQKWEEKLKGKQLVDDDSFDASEADKKFSRSQLPQPSRILGPSDMMTAEYVSDRLNVHVDDNGKCMACTFG